ncbi:histidyl-tRNA synthetase [Candidatus Blochmanniella floridana]|uniref:Histidine--tRNA ligase n=1 Tax=Blochmanniella floridana TaxID=203907 RepID=SYH_BLOFL|nr:RecName: Full=Histidine--tRNA ligase; AltName: Full=Histidyl-tRNA synthetase; Short=HisRS [Candidatus Blochmannia floridanus]CAD83217.1 histidyl-tRNA synthetase [Candidatus Blochmannia floridanus]
MIKYRNSSIHIQSVRGMHDCLPKDVIQWQYIEDVLKTILNGYGYNEIRFPIIECTDLFKRSIGEVTDVVEKEMYTFIDQHGNDLTLRPEGTSGCVRAGIENSLFYHQEPRLWYMGPMFRRERPQKGRYRQFHQFSAEAFGCVGPDIDVELILITNRCWKELGISNYLTLELNSIGLLSSRMIYRKKLISFLEKNKHNLDDSSKRRLYSNPMRILDTKNVKIKELLAHAPVLSDYLDDCSKNHFLNLCRLLDIANVTYIVNPYLVRGLDYYNRTVFEWVTDKLGVKKTICAGGRYDDLIKQLGGGSIPAVGFAIGLERVVLLMKLIKSSIINTRNVYIDVYLIRLGTYYQEYSIKLSEHIREKLPFLRLMVDCGGGNFKQQIDRAEKNNSRFVIVVDDKNFFEQTIILKELQSKKQEILKYDEIILKLRKIYNM